jgi:hypothetical protein
MKPRIYIAPRKSPRLRSLDLYPREVGLGVRVGQALVVGVIAASLLAWWLHG